MFHYLRLAAPHFRVDAPPIDADTVTRTRGKPSGEAPPGARRV